MSRIILALTLFATTPLLGLAQTSQADMTVFGYKLGEKFAVPECKCRIYEWSDAPGIMGKRYKNYQYTEMFPAKGTGDCFQRPGLDQYKVRKKDELPPLPAITNGVVQVNFDLSNAPKMCVVGSFSATVTDSKLTAIVFSIKAADADNVLETLKQKYGPKVTIKNFQAQNGYGATMSYYVAVWSFTNLTVTLVSSEHKRLDDPFGFVAIEIPKEVPKPKDNRAL